MPCCCGGPVGMEQNHVSTGLSPAWSPGWAAGAISTERALQGAPQEPQAGDAAAGGEVCPEQTEGPQPAELNSSQIQNPEPNPPRISSPTSGRLKHLRRRNSSSSSQIKSLPAHAWDLSLKESHTRLKSAFGSDPRTLYTAVMNQLCHILHQEGKQDLKSSSSSQWWNCSYLSLPPAHKVQQEM